MRTNIEIDDRLMAEAMRSCRCRTKRATVESGVALVDSDEDAVCNRAVAGNSRLAAGSRRSGAGARASGGVLLEVGGFVQVDGCSGCRG